MSPALGKHDTYQRGDLKIAVYANKNKPFAVGERTYRGIKNLSDGIFVVHESSRFPCFDESDELYETRYYHWYFICETWKQAHSIRKQLHERTLFLPQLSAPNSEGSWHSYIHLPASVVFYDDDSQKLIVAEKGSRAVNINPA